MNRIWGWGLTLMLFSCTSIENGFSELNSSHPFKKWLITLKSDYGEGRYYMFSAVDFTETGIRQPSLERLKKLINLHANIPEDCKKIWKSSITQGIYTRVVGKVLSSSAVNDRKTTVA